MDDRSIRQEEDFNGSGHLDNTSPEPLDAYSTLLASSSYEEEEYPGTGEKNDQFDENMSRQMVIYDPLANGRGDIEPIPEPQPIRRRHTFGFDRNAPHKILPSVGAFTVQCANCFKWRLIPTKEKYEEIREHILEVPFVCETAREWRPDISCDDEADISQDGSRLWAIDKPNIAQPPRGWQRLLRIRAEGGTRFADVYYQAPSGKRFRSMVEIQKFLIEHPEYLRDGVNLSQFSFQIPKPLQENYVRKRPADTTSPDGKIRRMSKTLECGEAVNPIAWARHVDPPDLQLTLSGPSNPHFILPDFDGADRAAKKKAGKTHAN